MRFSIEAEQAVIGGLLQVPDRLEDVQELVSGGDFYNVNHRIIFEAIESLADQSKPVDAVTVIEHLLANDRLEEIGGPDHVVELVQNTPGVTNIKAYAAVVADRAMERRMAEAGQRLFEIAEEAGHDVDEKLTMIHSELSSLERPDSASEVADFDKLLQSEVQDIDGRFRKTGKPGLKIGFRDIDERLGGIEETDFWVLAARPGMGKTTLAMNIVDNITAQGKEVLVFSLEMSKEQLTKRLVAASSGVQYGLLRSGDLQEPHWDPLAAGVAKLKGRKIHIVDTPAIDVKRALAISRKFSRSGNLGMIVFDYLQLLTCKSESRFDEVSQISRQLKAIAKSTKTPVLALSQLSRKCDERPNKRPHNSDLRESGQIEQDADLISFLYRDEVYNADSPDKGICEVITTKFRNGEAGTDALASQLEFSRFRDLDERYRGPTEPEEKPKRSLYGKR